MRYMLKVLKSVIIILLLHSTSYMYGQTHTIRGTVTDEQGPLPGVTIRIDGTKSGTITDADGKYTLELKSGASSLSLIFSFTGKHTQKIAWKGEKILDVKMKEKVSELKEVVVRARPNINEIDVRSRTGSVVQTDVARLKSKPAPSLGLALQGNVPGLQVINQGELGSKPQIRIRGTSSLRKGDLPNEPLYVLDGQVISPETFFALNTEDIKEIKILKDAVATALYGTKAANGVIEILSNRGFNGEHSFTYSLKAGITFRGESSAKMMNSKEKLELERLLQNPIAPGFLYSEKYIRLTHPFDDNLDKLIAKGKTIIDSLSNINTDWYRTLLRNNIYQSHNLSMRGGNEKTSYYTSIGFLNQGGQIPGNNYQRFSSRIALDHKLGSKAIWGVSINSAYGKTNTPNGTSFSLLDLVYKLNPYESTNSTQLYSFPRRGYKDLFNQFSSLSTDKILGISTSINYNITEDLELSAVSGIDFTLNEQLSVTPPTAFDEQNRGIPENERGKLSQAKNTTTNITSNVRLTYRKVLGKHDFVIGANSDFYGTLYDNLWVTGRGLYGKVKSAAAIDNSIDGINRATVGGRKQMYRNLGFGGLVGYTFDQTYDFFATYKLDASSVLPPKKRYNSAWALGLGWDLMKYISVGESNKIKTLKLRGSYGCTANLQGVTLENTIPTFGFTTTGYDNVRGLTLLALPNMDLKPEQNEEIDLGFQLTAWNTELNLSAYKRTTRDALLEMPIASSNGFGTQWRNVGVLENKGFEGSLSQLLLNYNDWYSRIRINIAYNKNKVLKLYGVDRIYNNPDDIIPNYEVGEPTDVIYGLKSQGINPITGEPTYLRHDGKEVNAFYKFERKDFVALGHSIPPITGSIYYQLSYKEFELEADFYYTLGGKRTYQYRYVRDFSTANQNAVSGQVDDMWFKSGDDNKRYPSPFILSFATQNLQYPSTRTVGSTDMIRLNNLAFRYRLPKKLLQNTFGGYIKHANIGVQMANLFTIKRFSESDPESGSIIAPLQPITTLSLNVTF